MAPVYGVAIILIVISSVYCDNAIPQNALESKVLLLLKKWRNGLVDSAIIPMPSLKSIKIPDVTYSYDRKGIKMNYTLYKLKLTGLDNFTVEELIALDANDVLEIALSINVPELTLYAENYELKGRAYLIYPLKGSGNMTVIFRDSDLFLRIRFLTASNGVSTQIEDFKFDFDVQQIETNLANSSWPINNVLNSEGVDILASYYDVIVQAMWDYIVPYVEEQLVNITTAQMVDTLLNINL